MPFQNRMHQRPSTRALRLLNREVDDLPPRRLRFTVEPGGQRAGLGSPGVDEIRWLKPVYPGDVLRLETEVTDVRPSRSKPEMGSIHSTITCFNQDDEPVARLKSIGLMRRRPTGGPRK